MGKTGGGPGTNQYGVKGTSKAKIRSERDRPAVDINLGDIAPISELWPIRGERTGTTDVGRDRHKFLLPEYKWVRKQTELDAVEEEQIALAQVWLMKHPCKSSDEVLGPEWLKTLHGRMLGRVWSFAGHFRTIRLNLGVMPHQVEPELTRGLNLAKMLIRKNAPAEEIGVRLHLDLVRVHPFMDGNGRHARVVAGEIARVLGLGDDYFTWGADSGREPAEIRAEYLSAVRHGIETNDIARLLVIAKS